MSLQNSHNQQKNITPKIMSWIQRHLKKSKLNWKKKKRSPTKKEIKSRARGKGKEMSWMNSMKAINPLDQASKC